MNLLSRAFIRTRIRYLLSLPLLLLFFSCNQQEQAPKEEPVVTEVVDQGPNYPGALVSVFTKHGTLDSWKAMQSLYFEIEDEDGNEKHYIQLGDRRDRVEGIDFTMGYDGTDIWLAADTSYKKDPVFYHNLMFYFYAMPFVLSDEGIVYSETTPLAHEGKTYPGIRISYEDGVGVSAKDEYFIHFDSETKQMAWLGYTVTYFSQEQSHNVKWIRYDNWQNVDGLVLPKTISWYNIEDGLPVDLRNTVSFVDVKVSATPHADDLFEKPAEAVVK